MKLVLITTLLFIQPVEECPAFLELKDLELGWEGQELAQRYADCMRLPSLPTARTLSAKARQCAPKQSPRGATKKATDWVNQIARELPGCETRLTIVRNSNAQD